MKMSVILLSFLTVSLSCTSSVKASSPRLEDQKLEVLSDGSGVYYQFCEKEKFLSSKCKEWTRVEFKCGERLLDLKSRGFYMVSRQRFKYQ